MLYGKHLTSAQKVCIVILHSRLLRMYRLEASGVELSRVSMKTG